MNKKYTVRLSDEERQQLTELTTTGKAAAYKGVFTVYVQKITDTIGKASRNHL